MRQQVPVLFDATLHIEPGGALHIVAHANDGWRINRRFTPSQLLMLKDWLQSPEAWREAEPGQCANLQTTIAFSHETGKIILERGGKTQDFDPHNDEHLARLVRKLKSMSPLPPSIGEPPLPNILPKPTEEELARRTIYANAKAAAGSGHRSSPKARYNQPSVSAEKTREIASGLLAMLATSGLKVKT